MKQPIVVLGSLVVAIALAGCLSSPTETDSGGIPSPVNVGSDTLTLIAGTYRNPVIGLQVTAPSGWHVSIPTESTGENIVPLVDMWDTDDGSAVSVISSYKGENQELDCSVVRRSVIESLPGTWSVDVEPSREVVLDGTKACGVRFTGREVGTVDTITVDQVFFMHRNNMLLITLKWAGADTTQPSVHGILRSVALF